MLEHSQIKVHNGWSITAVQGRTYNQLTSHQSGWAYEDSYGTVNPNAGDVCSHGCNTYAGFGMFNYYNAGNNWLAWNTRGMTTDVQMETTFVGCHVVLVMAVMLDTIDVLSLQVQAKVQSTL